MGVPPAEVDVWTPIGPTRINGQGGPWTGVLFHIAIPSANPDVLYVSSPTSGVWASPDRGVTWRDASGNLPTLVVVGLGVDAADPDHVFAALGGVAVFESKDGGGSWTKLGAPPGLFPAITDLLVDPSDNRRLHVRAQNGIYRSGDGGVTWQLSRFGPSSHLVMAPGSPNVLYAGLPGVGVVRTRDGGQSWALLIEDNGATDVKVAVTASSAATVYTRFKITPTVSLIYGTNDGGGTWTLRSGLDAYVALIAADDTDPQRVYVAGVDFFRSDDGGATWASMGPPHADHHAVLSDPGQPADIYTCCDGGLYRSTQATNWTFVADGILNVEFYDLAVSTTRPELAIGGTQDNGTILTDSSALQWRQIFDGDGGTVAIDPSDAQVMYMMHQYATSIARSEDGGSSSPTTIGSGLPDGSVCFNLRFGLHPTDPGLLLAGCGALWRTGVPSTSWTTIFSPPGAPAENVTVFAIGRDDMYYAGTNIGRVYVAPGGDSWELAFVHPSAAVVRDLVVDQDEPEVLYAAFAGGAERVYRIVRNVPPVVLDAVAARPAPELSVGLLRGVGGGPGPFTPLAIGAGLPSELTVNTLVVDGMRGLTIYAGTDRGVYRARSADQGASWQWTDYNAGLPPTDVRALRVQPTTGLMRAATFGRSAFQVYTDAPVGSLLTTSGRLTFLRVHDVGTGWGRPPNELDAEVVLMLDSDPGLAFGFQLRVGDEAAARSAMLDLLRATLVENGVVSVDFIRTGPRVGMVIRVARID